MSHEARLLFLSPRTSTPKIFHKSTFNSMDQCFSYIFTDSVLIGELSRAKHRSTMLIKFGYICIPESCSCDKSHVRTSTPYVSGCEVSHLLAAWRPRYKQSVTWYLGHPCYSQLTAAKKVYLLTGVTWLYSGLKCTTYWGDAFLCSPLTSYWFSSMGFWFSIDRKLRSIF